MLYIIILYLYIVYITVYYTGVPNKVAIRSNSLLEHVIPSGSIVLRSATKCYTVPIIPVKIYTSEYLNPNPLGVLDSNL